MRTHYNLLRYFPFLKHMFTNIFPKILDFTNFPFVQGNLYLLMEERNAYYRYSLDPINADKWNLKIIDTLMKNLTGKLKLKRIGPLGDGGYLVPESFCTNKTWITVGLGYNFAFENELVAKGCAVASFDHTLNQRPKNLNKKVLYFVKGWGSQSEVSSTSKIITLDSILQLSGFNFERGERWCLKFDIEGNEWKCINQINNLSVKPAIIICEIHGLLWGSAVSKKYDVHRILRELFKNYLVRYIHGNNYSSYFRNTKYGMYDIIELTLIRKDLANKENKNNQTLEEFFEIRNNKTSEQMHFGKFR